MTAQKQNHESKTAGEEILTSLKPPCQEVRRDTVDPGAAGAAPRALPDDLEGILLPPRPSQTSEGIEIVASSQRAPGESSEPPLVREPRPSVFSEYAGTAVKSSAIWSGAGAAIFCIESSLLAVAGHLAIGVKTLINEVTLRRGQETSEKSSASTTVPNSTPGQAGYRGLVADAINSPAFNTLATGVCYLAASLQCLLRGQLFEGSILATYFVGLMAMSNAIAGSYTGARTSTTFAERVFRSTWHSMPERFQDFLRNPSVWLAAGNLPLVGVTCNLANIATNPVVTTPAAVGLLLSEFGLVTALWTLVKGGKSDQSPSVVEKEDREVAERAATASFAQGMLLNSAGHLLVGASSLMQGALYIGAAKMCWCVACGLLGYQLRKAASSPRQTRSEE